MWILVVDKFVDSVNEDDGSSAEGRDPLKILGVLFLGTGLVLVLAVGAVLDEIELVVKSTATMGLCLFFVEVVFGDKVGFFLGFFVEAKANIMNPAKANVHLPPDRR